MKSLFPIIVLCFSLTGCISAQLQQENQALQQQITQTKNEAKAQVAKVQADSKVELATAKAKTDLLEQEAAANPLSHPLTASGHSIGIILKFMPWLNILFFLTLIAGLVFRFLPWPIFPTLGKFLLPTGEYGIVLTLLAIFVLPLSFWIFIAASLGAVGLMVSYDIKHKTILGGIAAVKQAVDAGNASSSANPIPPPTVVT